MNLRRYFYPFHLQQTNNIEISGDVFHHICHVCREDVGSRFELLSQGRAFVAEITEVGKRSARVRLDGGFRDLPPLPDPQITLVLSVPKFSTFEDVLEKASELGVAAIFPVVSEFSSIRKLNEITEQKTQRWQKILRGTYQQSGRGRELEIMPPISLAQALERFKQTENCFGLFAYEGETATLVSHALRGLKREHTSAWIFVGSEGGFSSAEVELFRAQGLFPASLGSQVLRVETACITLVSILKYERECIDERKF